MSQCVILIAKIDKHVGKRSKHKKSNKKPKRKEKKMPQRKSAYSVVNHLWRKYGEVAKKEGDNNMFSKSVISIVTIPLMATALALCLAGRLWA